MGISYGFGYVPQRRERVGEEVSEWVAEGGEGAFLGGLVSMRGREGRGRGDGGWGMDLFFLCRGVRRGLGWGLC